MVKFGQWAILVTSIYGLYLLASFYIHTPDALLDFGSHGLQRLAFTCFLLVAAVLLSRSIYLDWRGARSKDQKQN
jgi:hypothetical protein